MPTDIRLWYLHLQKGTLQNLELIAPKLPSSQGTVAFQAVQNQFSTYTNVSNTAVHFHFAKTELQC
jgi:hypothetical protein